jgi:hypothetical protein
MMKKYYVFFYLLLGSMTFLSAQDTTSVRMVGASFQGLTYFTNDTSVMLQTLTTPGGTWHGLFEVPGSGTLLALIDSVAGDGDRSLYQVSPFQDNVTKIYSSTGNYFAAADMTPGGRIFAIAGNGPGNYTPGEVVEIDIFTETETSVGISDVPAGLPRGLEFVPDSNKLFVYSGFQGKIFTMELNTWQQDSLVISNSFNEEVHGLYNDGPEMTITTYSGDVFQSNFSDSLGPVFQDNFGVSVTLDICVLDLIQGNEDTILESPFGVTFLDASYPSDSYQWYLDGAVIPGATSNSFGATQPGTYRLLTSVSSDSAGHYMWSEEVTIAPLPDTTSNRLMGITFGGYIFFQDNFDPIAGVPSDYSSGHALFHDAANGDLVAMVDMDITGGNRDFYYTNPLDGSLTLAYDPSTLYFAAADVTPDGRVFAITGNGIQDSAGRVYEIDLANQTTNFVATSAIPLFQPRGIEYVADSNKLFVAAGFLNKFYTMELDTWAQDSLDIPGGIGGPFGEEIHGMYSNGSKLWMSSYGGDLFETDFANGLAANIFANADVPLIDIVELDLIATKNTGYCAGSSVDLEARYSSGSYQWYRDGNVIPGATSATLTVNQIGTYRLLTRIDTTTRFIWSEEVTVNQFTVPNVNLNAPSTVICEGDSVEITGSFGGSSQWYLNGQPIAGANTNTYFASAAGSYNMVKINMSGCADSSSTPIVMTVETVDTDVTQNNATLTAAATGVTYQWIDCSDNSPVTDATDQTFAPAVNGDYAVIVTTANGCSDTSACTTISTVSLEQDLFKQQISLYPNPTQSQIQVDLGQTYRNIELTLYTVKGEVVMAQKTDNAQVLKLDLSTLPAGIYMGRVNADGKIAVVSMMKE